jgi:outer membrane protein TolC
MAAVDTTGIQQAALHTNGLTALEEEVAARRSAVTVAGAPAWPAMSLFANYNEQAYPDNGLPKRDDWYEDVNAGVRLNWTFFDGFRTRGAKEQARAMVTVTEQNLELLREELQIAVRRELAELQRAADDLHALSATGVAAVISGRALLEGRLNAEELVPFLPAA